MPNEGGPDHAALAELADVIHDLAHQLDIRHADLRDVVPLTGTEIAVIRQIHRQPGSTPSQIAEATSLHRSNVSTAVRTLEAGGLVVREQQQGNARSVTLVPTAKAAESVDRINGFWATRLESAPRDALDAATAAVEALGQIAASLGRPDRTG